MAERDHFFRQAAFGDGSVAQHFVPSASSLAPLTPHCRRLFLTTFCPASSALQPISIMSFFGRGPKAAEDGIITERMESALNEYVTSRFCFYRVYTMLTLSSQAGHDHGLLQSCHVVCFSPSIPNSHSPFNRSCHSKCVGTRYADPDLNKGESVCIDRCVAKYIEANKKVGERLQVAGANGGNASGK